MLNNTLYELAEALNGAKLRDRSSFILSVKRRLGTKLLRTIDSHNTDSILFVISDEQDKRILKAEFGRNTATHKEAGWYEHSAGLANGNQELFLNAVCTNAFALLLLNYVDGAVTLDEWALEHPAAYDSFGDYVLRAFAYDKGLFTATAKAVPKELVAHGLVSKYQARRREAATVPFLNALFAERHITINSRTYLTPDYALEQLLSSRQIWDRLLPESVGFIHGDLHTGNVLVKDNTLYYVDPNGGLEMPLEYDIAKMLHSVHGLYPLIMQGAFAVGQATASSFEFIVAGNNLYSTAHQKLRDAIDYEQYIRSVFTEAMHFTTMLPHHAKNQSETTALFLRSVQLFDELRLLL